MILMLRNSSRTSATAERKIRVMILWDDMVINSFLIGEDVVSFYFYHSHFNEIGNTDFENLFSIFCSKNGNFRFKFRKDRAILRKKGV